MYLFNFLLWQLLLTNMKINSIFLMKEIHLDFKITKQVVNLFLI